MVFVGSVPCSQKLNVQSNGIEYISKPGREVCVCVCVCVCKGGGGGGSVWKSTQRSLNFLCAN